MLSTQINHASPIQPQTISLAHYAIFICIDFMVLPQQITCFCRTETIAFRKTSVPKKADKI